MATCKDCLHYDICIFHLTGNENEKCKQFLNTADVAPKSEVAREIFAEIERLIFVGGFTGEVSSLTILTTKDYEALKKKYGVTDTNVGDKYTEEKE